VLCLSLDWANRRNPNELGPMVVSSSDGSISLLQPASDAALVESRSWHAHDFEPWIAAWNYWDSNLLYSGGDDLKLKGWDIRQAQPIFTNARFDGGVTSVQSNPHIEHVLAVGSYDSMVRIFDLRNPYKPMTQINVGGGAWRVKWHPSETRCRDLLVACMHDGFKVLRFSLVSMGIPGGSNRAEESTDVPGDWEVIKRFDGHESLAYGVDWSHDEQASVAETLVASCSFYDHMLHTWSG